MTKNFCQNWPVKIFAEKQNHLENNYSLIFESRNKISARIRRSLDYSDCLKNLWKKLMSFGKKTPSFVSEFIKNHLSIHSLNEKLLNVK